jgi:hypothetical protein
MCRLEPSVNGSASVSRQRPECNRGSAHVIDEAQLREVVGYVLDQAKIIDKDAGQVEDSRYLVGRVIASAIELHSSTE